MYADSVRVDVRPEEDFRGDGGEGRGSLERRKLSRESVKVERHSVR